MTKHDSAVAGTAALLVCLGCAQKCGMEYETSRTLQIPAESAAADQLWEAGQETLRRQGFRLDRVDRRAGIITTLPETSQHWFELWRRDVATGRDALDSTVNPLRRWAEVTFSPSSSGRGDESPAWQQLAVVVHKERLSSPDRQFNSSGAAYQFFAENLPSTTGTARVTREEDRWRDEGRDPAMEDRLLRAIMRRAAMNAPQTD